MEDETGAGKGNESVRDLGPQPLDAVMREHGLGNHDLVALRPVDLTHKAVQRARRGRRLTRRMKLRITEVLNAALAGRGVGRRFGERELFNYD